ncbi:hypothetical protein Pyn_04829 [Prunus yedoensis var. nudiflora]|uniref:Uncharacterized protein n=1 Tax=Prunus yedoensis var. nudiflora TaxID=2094558 RepID=A0A314UFT1_PRUYE|nr:hypothetical protein Pyn_04829 [Prunus yedoensis var. nudiflora]
MSAMKIIINKHHVTFTIMSMDDGNHDGDFEWAAVKRSAPAHSRNEQNFLGKCKVFLQNDNRDDEVNLIGIVLCFELNIKYDRCLA